MRGQRRSQWLSFLTAVQKLFVMDGTAQKDIGLVSICVWRSWYLACRLISLQVSLCYLFSLLLFRTRQDTQQLNIVRRVYTLHELCVYTGMPTQCSIYFLSHLVFHQFSSVNSVQDSWSALPHPVGNPNRISVLQFSFINNKVILTDKFRSASKKQLLPAYHSFITVTFSGFYSRRNFIALQKSIHYS
jgi:hypothetical protein